MAEGGFDPCECIRNIEHQQEMQRLISLLRNSQSQCSDTECFNELSGPQGFTGHSEMNFFLFLMGWMVIALALYFLRPSSLRNSGDSKPSNNQGPSSQPPPDLASH